MNLDHVLQVTLYSVIVLAFIYVSNIVNRVVFGPRSALGHNIAHSFRGAGNSLAMAIAMAATLGETASYNNFGHTIINLFALGFAMCFILLGAQYVNDKLIVSGINNSDAVEKGNSAVGITEFGGAVATGLIAYGSFLGVRKGVWLPAIIFFFLGQLILVFFFRLFDKLHPVDFLGQINSGNKSAAIIVAGMLISLGLVMKTAVGGEFNGWTNGLVSFGLYTFIGIFLLLIFYLLISFVMRLNFFSQTDEIEKDANIAFAIRIASTEVALAFVLSTLI